MNRAQKIIIVGAGALGREILGFIQSLEKAPFEVVGFIDDNTQSLANYHDVAHPILGTILDHVVSNSSQYLLAVGVPAARRAVYTRLKARGAQFITFIHPTAYVSRTAKLEEGCLIGPYASISEHARLGIGVFMNCYANVGHDAKIGDFCVLNTRATVATCELGQDVFVGLHGVVLPKVVVGDGAKIAAGSVAMRHVKSGTTVIGVPAQKFM